MKTVFVRIVSQGVDRGRQRAFENNAKGRHCKGGHIIGILSLDHIPVFIFLRLINPACNIIHRFSVGERSLVKFPTAESVAREVRVVQFIPNSNGVSRSIGFDFICVTVLGR